MAAGSAWRQVSGAVAAGTNDVMFIETSFQPVNSGRERRSKAVENVESLDLRLEELKRTFIEWREKFRRHLTTVATKHIDRLHAQAPRYAGARLYVHVRKCTEKAVPVVVWMDKMYQKQNMYKRTVRCRESFLKSQAFPCVEKVKNAVSW